MAEEIHTPRLTLRPITTDDAPALYGIRSHKAVYQHFATGPHKSVSAARTWIKDHQNSARHLMYTITLDRVTSPLKQMLVENNIIGVIGLDHRDKVHCMIDRQHWNQGYATEALREFLGALFEIQPARMSIGTNLDAENGAGRRVLEKCGGWLPQVPEQLVLVPRTAAIDEEEELALLKDIVDKHPRGERIAFRYVKFTKA